MEERKREGRVKGERGNGRKDKQESDKDGIRSGTEEEEEKDENRRINEKKKVKTRGERQISER